MMATTSHRVELPAALHDAIHEHAELAGQSFNAVVVRAVRAYLIRCDGDDYGLIFERMDRLAGSDEDRS